MAARPDGCMRFRGFAFPAIPAARRVPAISAENMFKMKTWQALVGRGLPAPGAQVIPAVSSSRLLESRVFRIQTKAETGHPVGFGLYSS